MDSSDDESIFVKKKSFRTKLLDSDDEDGERSLKPRFALVNKDSLFNSEESGDDKRDHQSSVDASGTRVFSRIKALGSDNEESRPSFNVLKKSDLYDAEESDDDKDNESTDHHKAKNTSLTHSTAKSDMLDNDNNAKQNGFSWMKDSDLYDADESDNEGEIHSENLEDISEIRKAYKSSKRCQSERKSKAKAVQQIHSETQRLVRESRVSLPYHRPRQRTLAEFLQRRQSLPSSVKLSSENIHQVW